MESGNTGMTTRDIIIQGCEELFYEKGYKETKFLLISEKTGKPKSLINYYFPVKADLVKVLIKRLIEQVAELVDDNVEEDDVVKQLVFNHIFYKAINCDRPTGTFISEVIARDERVLNLGDVLELFYYPIVETEDLDEVHNFGKKLFIYGSVMELVKNYFAGMIDMTWEEVIVEINRLNLSMNGVPTTCIQKYLETAKVAADSLDYSEIILLNVKRDG
ncbi:TetR/AcrR family transcriptional regulator [Eubacteriaceae bacterium ES3]|nr:TetR/AcrR family transcriptional regulator [Eubacteriaceae bacterium ES3]